MLKYWIASSVHLGAGNCDEVPGAEPLRGRAQRDDHGGQLQEKVSSDQRNSLVRFLTLNFSTETLPYSYIIACVPLTELSATLSYAQFA